jgi:predicted helicase
LYRLCWPHQVWLWNEFPSRHDFGGTDTGIDLVALTVDGDYWAVQCKCYQESTAIDKPAVDSFLATSSREFKDETLRTTRFAHRLWISRILRAGREGCRQGIQPGGILNSHVDRDFHNVHNKWAPQVRHT